MSKHSEQFLSEIVATCALIDHEALDSVAWNIERLHFTNGRLFILGVGGSAANASHAVNDFRKLCGIEAYAPTDNVAELTARTNDDGFATVFANWLTVSRIRAEDTVLIFSVGGGNTDRNVSVNIINAIDTAKAANACVIGIVGRDGGYTAAHAHACVIIPPLAPDHPHVTPITESFQAIIWHLLVSHPLLQRNPTKW